MRANLVKKFYVKLRDKTHEGRYWRLSNFHFKMIDDLAFYVNDEYSEAANMQEKIDKEY